MSEIFKPWRRYRFETKSTEDYRPLTFDRYYPWWCSGFGFRLDNNANTYMVAIIICYLPWEENLKKYWDDAGQVEYTEHEEIEFSLRFPVPDWYLHTKVK